MITWVILISSYDEIYEISAQTILTSCEEGLSIHILQTQIR